MKELTVRVTAGIRVGFWNPGPHQVSDSEKFKRAFIPAGIYTGPDLGDPIIGTKFTQKLMEGDLVFRVGILFRPDRNGRQRLETILILENYIPEMFNYEDWEQTG